MNLLLGSLASWERVFICPPKLWGKGGCSRQKSDGAVTMAFVSVQWEWRRCGLEGKPQGSKGGDRILGACA